MIKCPECGAKIEYLISREKREYEYCFMADNEGFGKCKALTKDIYAEYVDNNDYKCPECGATLFTDETAAINFLTEKK